MDTKLHVGPNEENDDPEGKPQVLRTEGMHCSHESEAQHQTDPQVQLDSGKS